MAGDIRLKYASHIRTGESEHSGKGECVSEKFAVRIGEVDVEHWEQYQLRTTSAPSRVISKYAMSGGVSLV